MTKKDQKRIQDRIDKCWKIKDLVEYLQRFDPDTPVGACGHFGEFYPMDRCDFDERETYVTTDTWAWRMQDRRRIRAISIESPDIGETPD